MIGWNTVPWLLSAVACAAAVFLFFQLRDADKRLGSLETQLQEVVDANRAKTAATVARAQAERAARSLAPADKLERLR